MVAANVTVIAFAAQCSHSLLNAVLLSAVLLAAAAHCRLSIFPAIAQQQTCNMLLQQSIDETDRQTDTGPSHRPYSAYYVSSVKNAEEKILMLKM